MNQFISPESGSFETGKVAGQAFVFLSLAALAVKCFSIARRPNANAKCAISLGMAICALIVAALAGMVGGLSPTLHALMILGGLISLMAIIAAAVLAIIGLVEYGNRERQYTQGRAQAIWTLSLSFLFMCFVMIGASRKFQQVLLNSQAAKTNQPTAGQWLVFDNFNFKIRAPGDGKPWVQWDAKKLNKNATVAFAHTDPQVFFIIVAENTETSPGMTTDGLAEIAKANLRSRTLALQILKENPVRRQGLDGVQMDSDAQIQAYHLFYRHWLFATNGYIYQLIAWGGIDDAAAVCDRSEELFSAFNLIDAQRQSAQIRQ